MAINCAAAESGGLIKKKESSWVKLKAFPTNVGRPKTDSDKTQVLPIIVGRPNKFRNGSWCEFHTF